MSGIRGISCNFSFKLARCATVPFLPGDSNMPDPMRGGLRHLQRDSGDLSGIRIELFGQFRVAANGMPLTAPVTHRMQALLAYLLLHADSPVSRQQLAFLFWPDATEPQARTNLRQLLHHLRSAWQDFDGYVEMDTQVLRW